MNEKIIEVIKNRLNIGAKKYGHEVDIHDGRDWEIETLEELLDACVYLSARILELKDKRTCNESSKVIDYGPPYSMGNDSNKKSTRVPMSSGDTEKMIIALDEMSSTLYLGGDNAESSEYAGLARRLRDASEYKGIQRDEECKTCE